MSLTKFTAPPNVPEIINFLNDSVDEFATKLDADATAVDSSKLGGTAASSYAKLASPTFTGTPKVPTAGAGTSNTQVASTAFVQQEIASSGDKLVPVGTIIAFAANSNPEGFVLCNGANVSRETYADLFAVIGTLYGEGDGSTTFTLPNLTDRFIEGSSTAGSYKEPGLPNITGGITPHDGTSVMCSVPMRDFYGALMPETEWATSYFERSGEFKTSVGINLNASRCSSVYGNAETVQPNSLSVRYYIKF